jgi:hypothetical protein
MAYIDFSSGREKAVASGGSTLSQKKKMKVVFQILEIWRCRARPEPRRNEAAA